MHHRIEVHSIEDRCIYMLLDTVVANIYMYNDADASYSQFIVINNQLFFGWIIVGDSRIVFGECRSSQKWLQVYVPHNDI